MTNEEKFKTPEERAKAFEKFCENLLCIDCPLGELHSPNVCRYAWLALEFEDEKPMDCPFCGSKCEVIGAVNHRVKCTECNYESIMNSDREKVIAAHNRICRAVKAYKESEVRNEEAEYSHGQMDDGSVRA